MYCHLELICYAHRHALFCFILWLAVRGMKQWFFLYTWVRALWIEFNNCPTRCDLYSLLNFCRQLYTFRVLTPIIRSSYNCNYSFWYWLTGFTTIRSHCWVGTQQSRCWVGTQQREFIRSSYNCNYSFWYWLTGSTTIRSRCWVGTQQREFIRSSCNCNYSCTSSSWWVSTPETCRAAYRNVINWISRILLDSY